MISDDEASGHIGLVAECINLLLLSADQTKATRISI